MEPELGVILRELNGLPDPLTVEVVARNIWTLHVLESILEEGVADGTFRQVPDVPSCRQAITAILTAFVRAHASTPDKYPRAAAVDQILNFYLIGLLAPDLAIEALKAR